MVDAILILSFGGPEGMNDVMPYLENVLAGKRVPVERMKEVAHHYELFDGVSPINQQNRELIAALKDELAAQGIDLPVYWGNRNWHPFLTDTMQQMKDDGVQHVLALFTSPYSSYSSCRQYAEDIAKAHAEVGEGAPIVEKLRAFFNHPSFIEANAARLQEALSQVGDQPEVIFTAHSIPMTMADNSAYVAQLTEASRLTAAQAGVENWRLVYQSRSGAPHQPWLEPDICDTIEALDDSVRDVVIVPIGFLSDHMEVMYDLDIEAKQTAEARGMKLVRAGTVGTHPAFVRMIRELIEERLSPGAERLTIGDMPASHDVCPPGCCM